MNLAMKYKVDAGEAVDVGRFSPVRGTPDPLLAGCVELTNAISPESIRDDELDFCDVASGRWLWSIGQREADGRVFAAFDARFYQRAGFVCLWLR